MVFRRNDVAWIAACAWRAHAKVDDIAALKQAKRTLDPRLIGEAAELVAALVRQLRGERAADAVTSVPCCHLRRPDGLGKQIAQAVADAPGLPFRHIDSRTKGGGRGKRRPESEYPPEIAADQTGVVGGR
jgi:hypothetical protein